MDKKNDIVTAIEEVIKANQWGNPEGPKGGQSVGIPKGVTLYNDLLGIKIEVRTHNSSIKNKRLAFNMMMHALFDTVNI